MTIIYTFKVSSTYSEIQCSHLNPKSDSSYVAFNKNTKKTHKLIKVQKSEFDT
jgi:hypothetical protein